MKTLGLARRKTTKSSGIVKLSCQPTPILIITRESLRHKSVSAPPKRWKLSCTKHSGFQLMDLCLLPKRSQSKRKRRKKRKRSAPTKLPPVTKRLMRIVRKVKRLLLHQPQALMKRQFASSLPKTKKHSSAISANWKKSWSLLSVVSIKRTSSKTPCKSVQSNLEPVWRWSTEPLIKKKWAHAT